MVRRRNGKAPVYTKAGTKSYLVTAIVNVNDEYYWDIEGVETMVKGAVAGGIGVFGVERMLTYEL